MSRLHRFCREGRADKVAAFVKDHPQLLCRSDLLRRQTPWHVAAKHNRDGVLLSLGSRLEALLDEATRCDDAAAVVRHLSSGHGNLRDMLLNGKDRQGRTPLILACERGHLQACQALLSLGADVGAQDKRERTSLHAAISKGHAACAEAVIACALVSALQPLKR
jgi:hypothetical protein